MSNQDGHQLDLSADQALILFDLLARLNETRSLSDSGMFEDQAEQRVLWDVEAMLESRIADAFRSDYRELVEAARARVRDTL